MNKYCDLNPKPPGALIADNGNPSKCTTHTIEVEVVIIVHVFSAGCWAACPPGCLEVRLWLCFFRSWASKTHLHHWRWWTGPKKLSQWHNTPYSWCWNEKRFPSERRDDHQYKTQIYSTCCCSRTHWSPQWKNEMKTRLDWKKKRNEKTSQTSCANFFFLILECLLRSNLSKRSKKH